jgi:tRNA(Ile2) C34 agmatinyltransferase TiaS
MEISRCENCGTETQWYGWLHGWLCSVCESETSEELEREDEAVEQQPIEQYDR